jgi:hypothetical protein
LQIAEFQKGELTAEELDEQYSSMKIIWSDRIQEYALTRYFKCHNTAAWWNRKLW